MKNMETMTHEAAARTPQKCTKPTMDAMRKRALAAVSQYLKAMGNKEFLDKDYQGRIAYAKGVICRAAKVESDSFNRIGRERLRGLTAMFNKMKRDMEGVMSETYKALGV